MANHRAEVQRIPEAGEIIVVKDFGKTEEQGARIEMQDASVINEKLGGVEGQFFAGVFDGFAGKEGAKHAETKLHEHFLDALKTEPNAQKAFTVSFLHTDLEITRQFEPRLGCTAATVFIEKGELDWARAGDSNIIHVTEESARRLGHDHKASNPTEQARIRTAGGEVVDGRIGTLNIARALGAGALEGLVIPEPETGHISLGPTDKEVIICSDAVTDMLKDGEIAEISSQYESAKDAAKAIKDEALNRQLDRVKDELLKKGLWSQEDIETLTSGITEPEERTRLIRETAVSIARSPDVQEKLEWPGDNISVVVVKLNPEVTKAKKEEEFVVKKAREAMLRKKAEAPLPEAPPPPRQEAAARVEEKLTPQQKALLEKRLLPNYQRTYEGQAMLYGGRPGRKIELPDSYARQQWATLFAEEMAPLLQELNIATEARREEIINGLTEKQLLFLHFAVPENIKDEKDLIALYGSLKDLEDTIISRHIRGYDPLREKFNDPKLAQLERDEAFITLIRDKIPDRLDQNRLGFILEARREINRMLAGETETERWIREHGILGWIRGPRSKSELDRFLGLPERLSEKDRRDYLRERVLNPQIDELIAKGEIREEAPKEELKPEEISAQSLAELLSRPEGMLTLIKAVSEALGIDPAQFSDPEFWRKSWKTVTGHGLDKRAASDWAREAGEASGGLVENRRAWLFWIFAALLKMFTGFVESAERR